MTDAGSPDPLESMTTEEIAEAVEATRYRKSGAPADHQGRQAVPKQRSCYRYRENSRNTHASVPASGLFG